MSRTPRYNDPSPLVCVEFLPEAERLLRSNLTIPQQWSVGHRFGKHASILMRQYGKHWEHFIGDVGELEMNLMTTVVVFKYVFLGLDDESGKPRFEIGDAEFRELNSSSAKAGSSRSKSRKLPARLSALLKSFRAWLILLAAIIGTTSVLLENGQILGIELQKLLGLASVGVGLVTSF